MDFSLDWMNESVPEAECSPGILKTDAELNLWSTQDGISEADKGIQLLESGFPPQKIWVLNNLDIVIKEGGTRILSRIFSQIMSWDEQMQIAAGIGLLNTVKKKYLPNRFFQDTLELAITFLSFYSRTILDAWMPVFNALILQVSVDLIKSKVIPMIILLSDYTQKPISRQVSCQLISSLAEVLGKEFKGQILQRAKALSQDTNAEVRQEMCNSWLSIAKVVGSSVIEELIFFEAVKLVHDAVPTVKAEAVSLFIQLLPYLSIAFLEAEAMQIIKSELLVETSASVQVSLSQHIGPLFISMKSIISKEDRASCIEILTNLADSDFTVRKNLAFNIPGVYLALGACKNLKGIITKLASDEEMEVRISIAAGLHEIVRQDPSCKIIRKISTQLFENPQTQLIMLKNIQHWQYHFQASELLSKFTVIINASNWRTQLNYLTQIKETFLQFPMKDIIDIFVPLLIYKMQSGSWPLKISSAELLANILYQNYYMARKLDICNILKERFARSNFCNDRITFLYFIQNILPLQSKQFFSSIFAEDTIRLGNDSVSAVRIKFVSLVPQIRESLQNQGITQLKNVLANLVEDPVQSVRDLAQVSRNILKSEEFNNKLQSEETQRNEQKKLKFEEEQGGQESREQDEKKKRMVDELAAKARADMQQSKSGGLKSRPNLGKSARPEVASSPKIPKPSLQIKPPVAVKKKLV